MANKLLATILSFIIVWESIPVSNLYAQTANVGSVTFNSIGIPQGSVPRSDVDYTKLSNRIKANLPETVKVNSKFLSDDVSKTNIELRKDANVYVTFLFEGAGYVNWFGYFLFSSIPASATATTVYPIFPNVDNSVLPLGTRIKIGNFKKGQKIGFVVVSDGYARPSDKSTILNGPIPWGYRTNGTAPKSKFFSLNSLNPAATVAKAGVDTVGKPMQRVAYQWDAENKLGVISFDDQLTGDYDFNDVTFTVDSDPADAIVPDDNVVVIGTVKVCHVDDKGKDTEYSFDLPTKQADYDLHKNHPNDFQGGCKDKVNICHYPPGNPGNPQNITIGAPAVNDHIGLHEFDAVVENKNVVCPAKYPACSATGSVIYQESVYDANATIKLTKNGNDYTCTKDICKAGAKVNVTLPYTLKDGETEMVNNSCPVAVIPTPTAIPTAEPVPTVAETLCEGGVAKIKDGPNKVCPISYCHYPPGNLNNPQLMTNMPPSSWEGSGNGNSGHSSHEKDILLTAGKTDCPSFIDVCRDGTLLSGINANERQTKDSDPIKENGKLVCPKPKAPVCGEGAFAVFPANVCCEMVNDVPTAKTTGRGSDGETCCNPNGCNTCDVLAPGDQCCLGVSETGEVNYKNCCQSPEGTNVTVGIDAHHEGKMCGAIPPKCEDLCNTKTYEVEKNKCGDYDHATYSTDLSRCEKPVSKEITICHYTSQDKSSAEIKNIEEKDWYLYEGSGDIKLNLNEGESASVEKHCPITKKVELCDPDNRCCRNTNDGPENQTGLYNGVCCPGATTPVKGSCDKSETKDEPEEPKLEYCPGTTIVKIPGIDCPKDAVLPKETCPDGSAKPEDGVCNKSVAHQTCAEKYQGEENAASLKCCEDLNGGGTRDHLTLYKGVCCPGSTEPVNGQCVGNCASLYKDNEAALACCEDVNGLGVLATTGEKKGYCCSSLTAGKCQTCESLYPGDMCCESINEAGKANFRQCCQSPEGKSLTEGIDPHDKSHSCGLIVDPPPPPSNEEKCQIPVIKVPMPDWLCGGLKKVVPLIAGNVATFMIFTCISAAVPSGWLYWLSMAGSMVNEIVNQFAYQDETKDVLKGTHNVNDALEHYKKLEQQLEVNMDNAKRKLDNYRVVMIAMLAAEVSAGVEAIILTVAAVAASATASATVATAWMAPFNMGIPYNPLGIVFPPIQTSYPLLIRPQVTNTGIFTPGVITYPDMGNPFIWLQCSVLPPPSPPEETVIKGDDLSRAETIKKLDGLCKVATVGANGAATSCAPTAAGEAEGVSGDQCSVTKTCKGAAYATLQCSGHSDAVIKELTGGAKTYCGGGGGGATCPPNIPGKDVIKVTPPIQGPPASSTGYSGGVVSLSEDDKDSGIFMDKFKNIFDKYEDSPIFKYLKNNFEINKFVNKLKIQDALAKFGFWDGVGLVSTILISVILSLCLSYFQIYPRLVWDPYLRLAFYTFFTLLMSVIYNEYEVIYHDAEKDYEKMKHIREEFELKVKAATPQESRYCPKKNYFEWLDFQIDSEKKMACGNSIRLSDFWMGIAFAAEDVSKKVIKEKKPLKNVPCFTTKDNMLNTDASCSCISTNTCAKFPNPPKLDFDKIDFYKKNSDAKAMLKDIIDTETSALTMMAGGKYEEGSQKFQGITKYKADLEKLNQQIKVELDKQIDKLNQAKKIKVEEQIALLNKNSKTKLTQDQIREIQKNNAEFGDLSDGLPKTIEMAQMITKFSIKAIEKNLNPEQKALLRSNDSSLFESVALKISKKDKSTLSAKVVNQESKNSPVSSKAVSLVATSDTNKKEPALKNVVYDIKQNDINKNSSQSIFKIISNRMIQKGVELEIFSSDTKK